MTTTDYPAAILANFNGDHRAAYKHLSKVYLAMEKQFSETWASRFLEISRFEADSPICLRQITEENISRSVDMADCEPYFVMRKWFYVNDEGEIQPVQIGRQERFSTAIEQPFHFAASAIIAGGKCVGEVIYTDH
jgi:hypothetical protein